MYDAGYMSGEAYELPETRVELQEPTLASIEEVNILDHFESTAHPIENYNFSVYCASLNYCHKVSLLDFLNHELSSCIFYTAQFNLWFFYYMVAHFTMRTKDRSV